MPWYNRAMDNQRRKTLLADWAERLAKDIELGTNTTGVFATFGPCPSSHHIDPAIVKEFMDSLPAGLLKMSKQ